MQLFLLCHSENVRRAVIVMCQDQKFRIDAAVEVLGMCQECFHTGTGNQGTQIAYSPCRAEQQQTHGICFDPHIFIIAYNAFGLLTKKSRT